MGLLGDPLVMTILAGANSHIHEEKLDTNKHIRTLGEFNCPNDESLEIFLKSFSITYQEDSQGITYLLLNKKSSEVIAYYTLKCSAIQINNESWPAIELARFAVDSEYAGKGLGTVIFGALILNKIKKIREKVAVKILMLFALDDVCPFYERFGLKKVPQEVQSIIQEDFSEGCNLMYVLLDALDKVDELAS